MSFKDSSCSAVLDLLLGTVSDEHTMELDSIDYANQDVLHDVSNSASFRSSIDNTYYQRQGCIVNIEDSVPLPIDE